VSPGILAISRVTGLAAVCIACDDAEDRAAAEFVFEDGDFRSLEWTSFHRELVVCGYDDTLGRYRFTSVERARADLMAGVFLDALAIAAARAQLTRKPADY
jgi:hypothetical protein